MKYCSKCGAQIMNEAVICPNCGCSTAVSTGRPGPAFQIKPYGSWIGFVLLTFITFGIYGIVKMSRISTDINTIATQHDGKKTMHYCLIFFIFSWLTMGIGVLVWYHKISARIGAELRRRGIPYNFGAGSFWGWNVLGAFIIVGPFIYTHKLLTSMNLLAENYNARG